ncbi:MAG: hypothetical protein PSV13_21840 [Lacunisphaera sp.]|nr:hypothetical protein [Lacunisphaera sp.]
MRIWPTRSRSILALLILTPLVGAARDWSDLLNHNPFYTAPVAPPPPEPAPQLELRGVVKEKGTYLLNVYDVAAKRSWWMQVGAMDEELLARGYDPKREVATLERQGKQLSVTLRTSSIRSTGMIAQAPRPRAAGVNQLVASAPVLAPSSRPMGEVQRMEAIAEEIRLRREQRKRQAG